MVTSGGCCRLTVLSACLRALATQPPLVSVPLTSPDSRRRRRSADFVLL